MPIKVPGGLPAADILRGEGLLVADEFPHGASVIQIAIVNLMPLKEITEVQLLRLLGNTPLNVTITLLRMASHTSKNTKAEHVSAFYNTFDEVQGRHFDGLIITGAPIEHLEFEEVGYWDELCKVMAWSLDNVNSVMHICWGAQAALYYHYGVPKHPLPRKMFGIFPHTCAAGSADILRGFDDIFFVPQSRHTETRSSDIAGHEDLIVLSESEEAGLYMAASADGRRHIFVTGHLEYDALTLKAEYERDLARGDEIEPPVNYFPPLITWRSHGHLLFSNWLNYCVFWGNS